MTDNMFEERAPEGLAEAVKRNDIGAVEELLRQGVDPDSENQHGSSALEHAIFKGFTPIAFLLINNGANVNQRGRGGLTPLMCAANIGDVETARLLIDKGAEIDAAEADEGTTALMMAVVELEEERGTKTEIVRLLVESGADTGIKDRCGATALAIAEQYPNQEIVEILKDEAAIRRGHLERERRRQQEIASAFHDVASDRQSKLKMLTPRAGIIRGMKP